MATNQKMSDLGWMYFAPAKPQPAPEPTGVMSQIPDLNDLPHDNESEGPLQRGWIKESDSPYIRLAKQGGRPDLLQFRDPKPRSNDAKGYPRCDWFYQEDNALQEVEENQNKEKSDFVFMLPEYMVHEGAKDSVDADLNSQSPGYVPKRLPYAIDTTSIYERDARATDKTAKIPETKKAGFGVRFDKQKGRPCPSIITAPVSSAGRRHKPMPPTEETNMAKLLNGGYNKDWFDQLEVQVNEDHKTNHKPRKTGGDHKHNKPDAGLKTEYQETYALAAKDARRPKYGRRATDPNTNGDGVFVQQEMKKMEREVETMFKLSKFKDVPARIDTNIHYKPVDVIGS